jgi:hypothetical protein
LQRWATHAIFQVANDLPFCTLDQSHLHEPKPKLLQGLEQQESAQQHPTILSATLDDGFCKSKPEKNHRNEVTAANQNHRMQTDRQGNLQQANDARHTLTNSACFECFRCGNDKHHDSKGGKCAGN